MMYNSMIHIHIHIYICMYISLDVSCHPVLKLSCMARSLFHHVPAPRIAGCECGARDKGGEQLQPGALAPWIGFSKGFPSRFLSISYQTKLILTRLGASNLILKELQLQPKQQLSLEADGLGSAKLWARTCSEVEVFQDCWKAP